MFGLGKNSKGQEAKSDDELVRYVEEEYKRRQEERRPWELQWRLNLAFVDGQQYMDINPGSGGLSEIPKLYWWTEREVFNQTAPVIETRLAKLARMRPILKCRPGTDAQDDIRAAKVGTILLSNIQQEKSIRNIQAQVNSWSETCGTGILKHLWNPRAGPVVAKVMATDEVTGEPKEEEIREGDLDVIVCPPQEIFPDSNYHQDIGNCRSIMHTKSYHVDEIMESWDQWVDPEETSAMQLHRTMIGMGGLGYGNGSFGLSTSKLKDHAVVKELWEVPSRKRPQGRLLIVAGKKVLYQGPLPYPIGNDGTLALPFTKVCCIERPGMFWGRSIVERIIPIQRRYNALRNRKAEYLNRCVIGQWVVEEGSVDLDILETEAGAPGSIVTYARGFNPPKQADNPQLPVAFETEENTLLQELSMISGVSELSRQSNAPPGVKSGVALSIALEQDDTRLSSTAGNIEQFFVENGKIWLRMHKKFVQGSRTLRKIGKNNVIELMDWTAADIRSDDVVVDTFSALAESPAQRRQMVFDLLNTGLFNDPDTGRLTKEIRHKILEIIEMGNWETSDDSDVLHLNKAERENRQITTQGIVAIAASYDDAVLHIKIHNEYRLTTDYEEIIAQNRILDEMMQEHVNMHLQHLMASMPPPDMAQAPQPTN